MNLSLRLLLVSALALAVPNPARRNRVSAKTAKKVATRTSKQSKKEIPSSKKSDWESASEVSTEGEDGTPTQWKRVSSVSTESSSLEQRFYVSSLFLSLSTVLGGITTFVTSALLTLWRNSLCLLGCEKTQWKIRNRSEKTINELDNLHDSPSFFSQLIAGPATSLSQLFTLLTHPSMLIRKLEERAGLSRESAVLWVVVGNVLALFFCCWGLKWTLRLLKKSLTALLCPGRRTRKRPDATRRYTLVTRQAFLDSEEEDESGYESAKTA